MQMNNPFSPCEKVAEGRMRAGGGNEGEWPLTVVSRDCFPESNRLRRLPALTPTPCILYPGVHVIVLWMWTTARLPLGSPWYPVGELLAWFIVLSQSPNSCWLAVRNEMDVY